MSVLVVTGGGRGIGAEICRLGAERGWAVCVNYDRNAAAAERIVADIAQRGGRAIAMQADVAIPEQVAAMFARVDSELTRPAPRTEKGLEWWTAPLW